MKRSIIATLLILVLALSGCKAQQESGTAAPAERVEAEKKQETSQAVPEESETEQELPAEEEKPVEQDQADEQEKPVEEEPKGDGSEIVKFWETVPEMSLDEAKEVMRAKQKRIRNENKLGTLTDEERMALYITNINYYEGTIGRHPSTQFEEVCFRIFLCEDFKEDIFANPEAYRWEKQEFAKPYGDIKSIYDDYIVEVGLTVGFNMLMGSGERGIVDPYNGGKLEVWVYPNEDVEENVEYYANCLKEILRYYLSLNGVGWCRGPVFRAILSYD